MKMHHSFGFLILKSVGMVLFASVMFLGCSKDAKNPVKPSSKEDTGTVTDIDGNIYRTVKIGNQWWMAENLKVTHYRTGEAIPLVTKLSEWKNLSTSAYCDYNNDANNVAIYGRLYNWYAANDSRTIAPAGWHVTKNAEWDELILSLGGTSVAGGKLKESGLAHWKSPNNGATNEYGFSALPGGWCGNDGVYGNLGINAIFWPSTESYFWPFTESYFAWCLTHSFSSANQLKYTKQYGLSVRCVKDND